MSDFKSRRRAAGLSQSGLAKAYGDPRIDKYLISKIESGIVSAPPELENFVLQVLSGKGVEISAEASADERKAVATPGDRAHDATTRDTRLESYRALGEEREKRQKLILEYIREHGPSTSREIAYGLGFSDLNAVKPRLTELKARGRVEVVGAKVDMVTERRVSVWAIEEGEGKNEKRNSINTN